MADAPKETPTFQTDEVKANLAIEAGQGVGARELAAQRDPGGVNTADEDEELENGVAVQAGDKDQLDENVSVQGLDNAG
ncbi:MAG: hypothetical protein DI552_03325 [Brevundimonas sp.]|uniref:Uncharacterized protein n=1 Tax=Brevundimonas albigilva TaxID=1312364 RepID=A0ABY4SHU4_9CAUL|nr:MULTISPECIES: hypothetical protein [Brevundimonas]PZU61414.1 MAG: hypothetical protein DI552_03325 [Brevundimonas sp.]UQV17519.1 hypothetical protein MU852_11620 [Brevundimonas albigilva]URI14577.1 hypothetical protein M8231_12235 [Brevundimonas albigilva]